MVIKYREKIWKIYLKKFAKNMAIQNNKLETTDDQHISRQFYYIKITHGKINHA